MWTHFWQPEFGMRSPKIRLYTSIIRQRTWTIYHNLMAPNHFQSGPQVPRTAPDFFGLDEQWMNFWNQGNGIACEGAIRRMLTLNGKGTKPNNCRYTIHVKNNTCSIESTWINHIHPYSVSGSWDFLPTAFKSNQINPETFCHPITPSHRTAGRLPRVCKLMIWN